METKHLSYITANYSENLFGISPNGDSIYTYEISNKNGLKLQVTNYGATITSLKIPLKNGQLTDVVLGFDNFESYLASFKLPSAPYFGATVGRFAGRIKKGIFSLNNKTYQLSKNNGKHSLHGGKPGFSQAVWNVRRINFYKNPSITLSYFSPDGEAHYPGGLTVELTYTLTEKNELVVEYHASTDADTIINLTHHSYFNLDGHDKTISEQELFINSKRALETTDENIPTGRSLNLSFCPFDFTSPKKCPSAIDTTFILDKSTKLAASLFSKKNNLKMYVYTNQPAVHIYVGGDCFDLVKGKEDTAYHKLSGICFETQNFPDAPNHSHFPDAVLKKGDTYHHKTIYQFELL